MLGEHLLEQLVDRALGREVRAVDLGQSAERLDLASGVLELCGCARDEQHRAAGPSDLERGRTADPARRASHHQRVAIDRAVQ
jgi:nucleoside-diphosphate-sugar epimerase